MSREFIFPLLVSHGIAIDHIDFDIEGSTLSEPQARLLDLPAGFPILILAYTPIGPDGRPILTGRTDLQGRSLLLLGLRAPHGSSDDAALDVAPLPIEWRPTLTIE